VWPSVAPKRGHYESFYLRLSDPDSPLGVWIRHTVHKPPGAAPHGSIWFVLFGADGPQAAKVTVGESSLSVPDGGYIRVGDASVAPGHAAGSVAALDVSASWDLSFTEGAPAFRHLQRGWMYRAPVPRTKTLSPYPASSFSGTVDVNGRVIDVDGWRGMVGHNWGAEHAERWIWTNGTGFSGSGVSDAYFDAALGRIKIGRFVTPWIGNGVLSVDGTVYRLGGPAAVRSTVVRETPHGAQFVLPGSRAKVSGRVGAPVERFVGWEYADPEPDAPLHNTVNCSIASMTLQVERDGEPPLELHTDHEATYELGMRETDHGMPLQPFPDGARVPVT
jgi:hypothetical protein